MPGLNDQQLRWSAGTGRTWPSVKGSPLRRKWSKEEEREGEGFYSRSELMMHERLDDDQS